MANFTKKASIFSVLLVFLIMSPTETRELGIGFGKPVLVCNLVYGAEQGDSCSTVAQKFKIEASFSQINPNLNCSAIFVSQWLCINGTSN